MLRSLKLGRLFGIPIYVHSTFLLLPLLVLLTNQGQLPVLFLLVLIVAIFGCVVLHELGHALMARYFGIGTRDITLYPIGGVARLERMSDKPWEEFFIAIAGPAVNVVIVALLLALALVSALFVPLETMLETTIVQFLGGLGMANVLLVLFNMVPAFPMDGGRVFRALLSLGLGQLRATRIAAAVGLVVSLLFMLGGLLSIVSSLTGGDFAGNSMLLLVGMFVMFAGQMELRHVEWKHRMREEEDLDNLPEVIPVRRPIYQQPEILYPDFPHHPSPTTDFTLKPKVSVYVWDNQKGVWTKEPGTM